MKKIYLKPSINFEDYQVIDVLAASDGAEFGAEELL